MSKPENKAFAQMFQKQFSGKFLELYMSLLSVVREDGYLPDRVINLALQYLNTRYQTDPACVHPKFSEVHSLLFIIACMYELIEFSALFSVI
jgi:hypothetical protein